MKFKIARGDCPICCTKDVIGTQDDTFAEKPIFVCSVCDKKNFDRTAEEEKEAWLAGEEKV
jgi:hypothetical protein